MVSLSSETETTSHVPGTHGSGAGGGAARAFPNDSERIELQEAVCDALLGMMHARATGAGDLGDVLYRVVPNRQLVSGFLLPKYKDGGADATNDIKIATHGMDFRVREGKNRTIVVEPSASIYVRLLPTADELFDPEVARRLGLRPRTRLKKERENEIKAAIRERMQGTKPAGARETRREYAARRARVAMEVLSHFKIHVRGNANDAVVIGEKAEDQNGAQPPAAAGAAGARGAADGAMGGAGDGAADGGDDAPRALELIGVGHDIPDNLAVGEPIPQKWKRLTLDLPSFEFDPNDPSWRTHLVTYNMTLAAAPLAAVNAFLATQEGQDWAWRRGLLSPSTYRSREAWEHYLATARTTPPDPALLSNGVVPALTVDVDDDPLDPGHRTVRVAMENRSVEPDVRYIREVEPGLFGVTVRVTLPEGTLARLAMDRVKPSYHLAGWLDRYAIGVNGGVDHERLPDSDPLWLRMGSGDRLTTTWMPRWVQPRIEPTDIPGVSTEFAALANEGKADGSVDGGGLDGLAALPRAMRTWVECLQNGPKAAGDPDKVDPEDGILDADDRRRERDNFADDVKRWLAEADAIELGVQTLLRSRAAYYADPTSRDAIPFRAWLATNEAFGDAGQRKKVKTTAWRLFQLAFVLALVPALVSRLPEYHDVYRDAHEDAASLLYFPTGGGKSEAFFGIMTYGLFFDRMRGKERGITAMVRYPLRLLTLQQAQRLSKTLASAERVRRRLHLSGRPFEIGFYVGSANTPNTTMNGARVIEELADIPTIDDPNHRNEDALAADNNRPTYLDRSLAYNKIPSCPFCGAKTVLRMFPREANRLGVVCTNEAHGEDGCFWNQEERRQSPLPFILVDTDIYRRAPSVLIGTVDKLALIGQNRYTIQKIAGMYGLGRWFAGEGGLIDVPDGRPLLEQGPGPGYEPLAPAYTGGIERFHDPFPLLLTQDEGHLLEESLGTFAGLFETANVAWYDLLAPLLGPRVSRIPGSERARRPKVVVATATVSDPNRQVRATYQKSCVRFPHQGPSLYTSFYARPKRFPDAAVQAARRALMQRPADEEWASPWMRVYASLMTNGRPHTTTTVTVLAMHHLHITQALTDLDDPATAPGVVAALTGHLSRGPLHDRHAAVLAQVAATGSWAALRAVIDLFRITLTYVTNKKGGDQIMAALNGVAHDLHLQNGRDLGDLRTELISGGVDAQKIQDIIRMAEEVAPPGTPLSEMMRGVVATSAISHGVDVDNFNAMVFAGLPSDIAEYIQASSRIGRLNVGFSLLVPTPQARRDRYVVEIHETYHRFLERMIAPPAVERWADRAVERVIPSLFQNWLIGFIAQKEFKDKGVAAKHTANLLANIGEVATLIRDVGEVRFSQRAVAHIVEAIGVTNPHWPAADRQHYETLIAKQIKAIIDPIVSGNFDSASVPNFWDTAPVPCRPMTSLRDVDEGGVIAPTYRTLRETETTPDRVKMMMRLIRNGTLSRHASSSELDDDDDPTDPR